ncbi:unnamed protein product [Schistosoma bovis]|nr:unnamed protein product [Schistosoma bovis]
MEHSPSTSILLPILSWASLSNSIQFLFIFLMSFSISRLNVCFVLLHLLWYSGFQVRVCLVMQLGGFFYVCLKKFQCFFMITSSAGICFVISHSRLLLIVSGQRIGSISRRQLLINTCMFWMLAFIVLQVSVSFVLKILTLVLVDICFEFQMFFSCRYAALALPIRTFTSASDPPCSSMVLPRYVLVFTSFKAAFSSVI